MENDGERKELSKRKNILRKPTGYSVFYTNREEAGGTLTEIRKGT